MDSQLAEKIFSIQQGNEEESQSAGFLPWSLDEIKLELLSSESKVFLVGEPPQGFVLYRAVQSNIEILHLAVRPIGQGWGTKLLQQFFSELRKLFPLPIEIFLEVSSRNHGAISCYEKNGLSRLGIRKSYYRNGDDALNMKKVLFE